MEVIEHFLLLCPSGYLYQQWVLWIGYLVSSLLNAHGSNLSLGMQSTLQKAFSQLKERLFCR